MYLKKPYFRRFTIYRIRISSGISSWIFHLDFRLKLKYCFYAQLGLTLALIKGLGIFNSYVLNLSLHFTPGLQSAFYTDQFENTTRSSTRNSNSKIQVENPNPNPNPNPNSKISMSRIYVVPIVYASNLGLCKY